MLGLKLPEEDDDDDDDNKPTEIIAFGNIRRICHGKSLVLWVAFWLNTNKGMAALSQIHQRVLFSRPVGCLLVLFLSG